MHDTKEHILEVSFGLFLQKSFKEVTMQEIVEKTGMSKGAFYHYFESKEQLFLEVINKFIEVFIVDYTKLSKESLYDFYHDYIKHSSETSLSFLQKQNEADSGFTLNYYTLIFDAMKLFPSLREREVEELEKEFQAWQEAIRRAKEQGEIKSSMTDEQIARIFIYVGDGVGMRNIITNTIEDTGNTLLSIWDSFYKALST